MFCVLTKEHSLNLSTDGLHSYKHILIRMVVFNFDDVFRAKGHAFISAVVLIKVIKITKLML